MDRGINGGDGRERGLKLNNAMCNDKMSIDVELAMFMQRCF
jgi:hypothetical protein